MWFFLLILLGLFALFGLQVFAATQAPVSRLEDQNSVFAVLERTLRQDPLLSIISSDCEFRVLKRKHIPVFVTHFEHRHTHVQLDCWREAIDDVRRQPMRGQLAMTCALSLRPPRDVSFSLSQREGTPTHKRVCVWSSELNGQTLAYLDRARVTNLRELCERASRALDARSWSLQVERGEVRFRCDFDARKLDGKLLLGEFVGAFDGVASAPIDEDEVVSLFERWGQIEDIDLARELGRRWVSQNEVIELCHLFATLENTSRGEVWRARWAKLAPSSRVNILIEALTEAHLDEQHAILAQMLRAVTRKEAKQIARHLRGEEIALVGTGRLTLAACADRRGDLTLTAPGGMIELM